ncbi:MAG: DUF4254 domain-containing protein [Pedobacter sp.]
MIDVNNILSLQKSEIADWHLELTNKEESLPWKFIEENNQYNFKLWHEEDIARIQDIEPMRIVQAKRSIDQYNQARNNAMEKIDEWILNYLELAGVQTANTLHSETPGMMIDRLSIMQLKRYHMEEETLRDGASAEHKSKCLSRVNVLNEQITDLSNCLTNILKQLVSGKLKFKVYRQFKMYNDPSLNPQLYKKSNS